MTDDRFNGWSNWDTWNAHLWLANEEPLYREARRTAGNTLHRFEVAMKDLLTEIGNPDGIDFDNVDWAEVYDAFNEE